jgi:hypothetical protein
MKTMRYLKGLPVAAVFIFTLGAQTALADHHEGNHASDKNDNVEKTFPDKDGQKDLTNDDKSKRKLDAKQSGKKRTGSNSKATSTEKSDSSTINKGTGNPETTTPGSGTGYSGAGN